LEPSGPVEACNWIALPLSAYCKVVTMTELQSNTNIQLYMCICGPVYRHYGLGGPGIESRWGRDFPHLSRQALKPNQPPIQWLPGLSRW